MSRVDAWYMVRRRAKDAGMETAIGNHSFRAIGITDYLERGGDINIAKRMAGHSNVKTTELYDRRGDDVSFSEIERVGI
jgi:integrase/recombinase XerD